MDDIEDDIEDLLRFGKRIKRKVKGKIIRTVIGTTPGERANIRRLRRAQEAWRKYMGPLTKEEFMRKAMKRGAKSKEKLKRRMKRYAFKKRIKGATIKNVLKRLEKVRIKRRPLGEEYFKKQMSRVLPGGEPEAGEVPFMGSTHRPDWIVSKDIVIEFKMVTENTELHTALGQALIYRLHYPHVVLVIYNDKFDTDITITRKNKEILKEMGIYVITKEAG